ncbi:hypothetical protein Tco_0375344 [Tanacetum coccineum]
MRETHVDLQSQGNYTLFRETMALPVQNINHSAFRSMFEKEKLSGNNFNDWFARLKLVLRVEKKMHVIEQPLPPAPEAGAEPNIVAQWTALYDAHTEIACLMLGSMTPELHRQFELHYPYDMIQELRSMFEKQAGVEKFDLIQSFHACKQEEGKSVADYVLKMKGYVEQLERLGYMLPQDISVGLILNGLTKDFVGFIDSVMSDWDEWGLLHGEDLYVEAALQAPPSPDYVPGLEEPEQAPPLPDYVPGPKHDDDEISDPEANREEDDDEDPEENPVDYPADGGDDGDNEDEPSEEDEDDDVDIETDEDEEEEEHPAPADSVVVALPATDQAPSVEETEPFETDEFQYIHSSMVLDAEVARLLALSSPPSSPLPMDLTSFTSTFSHHYVLVFTPSYSSLPLITTSPLNGPRIYASHLFPLTHPSYFSLPDQIHHHQAPLPISVLTSSPPLLLPSASRVDGTRSSVVAARPARGLRADYGFVATIDREIRRDPEREVGYGITDSWDEIVETLLAEGRAHAYTRHQMETEARLSREAWRRSMDASDLARGEAVALEMLKADHRRSAEMRELRTTDRTRQKQLIQTLTRFDNMYLQMIGDPTTTRDRCVEERRRLPDLTMLRWLCVCIHDIVGSLGEVRPEIYLLECGVQGHFKRECLKLKNNKKPWKSKLVMTV